MSKHSRRQFLKTSALAGGGLIIGFYLPTGGRRAQAMSAAQSSAVNAWLKVGADNTFTVLVGSAEMGQGVFTSIPMLLAEELQVRWQDVRAETAPVAPVYNNPMFNMQATGGSTTTRAFYDVLRQVGAQTRELFIAAGAQDMGVDPAACQAVDGSVVHPGSGQSRRYADLLAIAAQLPPPPEVDLKPATAWQLLGTPAKRLDVPAKVNGQAEFGIDVQVDGMLVATVRACPVFGGKLKSVDEQPALAVAGVKSVLPLDSALIVIADGYWAARKGASALQPVWDFGANADNSSARISALLHAGLEQAGHGAHTSGNPDGALQAAARTVESIYQSPLLSHSPMEPMNATASVSATGVEIWAPTQAAGIIPRVVSGLTGVPAEQVQVHTTFLGGGFGRRFEVDFIVYAVLASKAAAAPVKVIWSREEDTQHGFYRPASVARMRGGLAADGRLEALQAHIVSPSITFRSFPDRVKDGVDDTSVEGIADSPYAIPNFGVTYLQQEIGVPVGYWRSVGNSQNGFVMESFIDELAHAGGVDPYRFRRGLLTARPDHLAVLDRLAEVSGWGQAAQGRFQGIALHECFGSIVGEVAEISIEQGRLVVHQVTCVVDCGTVINPDTVEAQMQSAIVYGLTAALHGEITIDRGRVQQGNFNDYRMVKLAQTPRIEVHLAPSGRAMGGIGEPALPPLAPALANAIFAATGKRLRQLPITPESLRPA
jgi:isoquinoline 1-oxidoreductase beta subunit